MHADPRLSEVLVTQQICTGKHRLAQSMHTCYNWRTHLHADTESHARTKSQSAKGFCRGVAHFFFQPTKMFRLHRTNLNVCGLISSVFARIDCRYQELASFPNHPAHLQHTHTHTLTSTFDPSGSDSGHDCFCAYRPAIRNGHCLYTQNTITHTHTPDLAHREFLFLLLLLCVRARVYLVHAHAQ